MKNVECKIQFLPPAVLSYFPNSRGERGDCGSFSCFSPVSENTSLNAPMVESILDVSIGIKTTFELFERDISRKLSM